jgi:hypothetical protein
MALWRIMSKQEHGNKHFELQQAKRGNSDKPFRLYTLHPRSKRTRYVQAASEVEATEKADELVAAEGECGMEVLTPRGWDVDSIFGSPSKEGESVDLNDLPEPSGEKDPE